MKRISVFGMFLMTLALGGVSSACYYQGTACDGLDVCFWDKELPLGSSDTESCGLTYNTYWPVNTQRTVICIFNAEDLTKNYDLYLSIDNDILECKLNGVAVMQNVIHENCAPADPRDGFHVSLAPHAGINALVCRVKDRGVMSHFDACITKTTVSTTTTTTSTTTTTEPSTTTTEPSTTTTVPTAPEFGSMGLLAAVLLVAPVFAYLVVKRKE